ncbi:pimeloyl-ACP methyl ester carboxylesterase [Kitasatospora sp. MAA4]|uniref:alpha/beta fold hydrolase n=1 Tax=Kitasatospora sp. MAA4 TaxID=3035093 RepID=UPI00247714AC|nr:alpha/beta fold hydrolase [Kitasatospora sp. MAA4]MDH6135824.1 pimeloyl-ACP methyl ester carboxylesterase [Kitasatospora sp. MAA4]
MAIESAATGAAGAVIRWIELPGSGPVRVYLHGLGAMAAPYFTEIAAHPLLAGHRSLLVDLLGFGLSDRPADFDYRLESHADAVADALRAAGVSGADLIGHSMGGAVAIVLAHRHPELVARLVVVEPNLDPITPSRRPGSSGLATYTESEFLAGGWAEVLDRVGPYWAATMRLADPLAVHRSAVELFRGSVPIMRELLTALPQRRTLLAGEESGLPDRADELEAAGVELITIPAAGHNVMLDQPDAFARAVAEVLGRA